MNWCVYTSLLFICTVCLLIILLSSQGYLTGGKDGIVTLWDEAFKNQIKSYSLQQSSVTNGCCFHTELPPIRSLSLGQECILVGTKNSEVRFVCGCMCVGCVCVGCV